MPTTKKNNNGTSAFFAGVCKNPFVLLGVFCLLATPFLMSVSFRTEYLYAGVFVIVAVVATAIVLHRKGMLTTERMVVLLFIIAMVLHTLYVLRFGHADRQHDTGPYTNTWGHIGYIQYFLYNNFQVPYYDPRLVYGFYNPPLHHFLCAVFLKVITLFDASIAFSTLAEAAQVLTLFYSLCTTVVGLKIAKILGLKDTSYLLASIIIVLHPVGTILAGSINNDNLCFLLMLCALYRTLKWYKDPTAKNIAIAAAFMGLSLLAKTSAVYIAPGIAVLFLYQFFKEKQWKKYIMQYALFAIIAIPIGLSWVLRCYFLFDMPLSYIPEMGVNSGQYLGTGLYRLFDFSMAQWSTPFVTLENTNIFISMIKTSIFGEWTVTELSWVSAQAPSYLVVVATIFLIITLLLIALSLYAGVAALFRKNQASPILKICLAVIYATTLCTYLIFCFAHPQLCTTDYRYIPITFIIGAVSLGATLSEKKWLRCATLSLVGAFGLLSTVYYLLILVA